MFRWLKMVPILAYHRVGAPKADHVPTVTPGCFERQLAFLVRRRYDVMDLPALVDRLAAGQPISRKVTAITFDDGYEETLSIVAPLLRRFGLRATVFITPTEVGLQGFLTWDQVRRLAQDGVTIGSHTMHHTYLPLASAEQVRQELTESKQIIEREVGRPIGLLSYPIGGFSREIQAAARGCGYRAACTTNRIAQRGIDLFALRRIKMTERDRRSLRLWAKLSGYYDCFRELERPA